MFFTVDPSSGVAIYLQIVRQIKFAIAEQTLRPGHLLPSVRQLSQQLAVNPNTVARAIGQLQADGVVESLRGRGTVVSRGALATCRRERKAIIANSIGDVLTDALHAGLSVEDVRRVVEQKLDSLNGKVQTISTPADEIES
jgi:GntR family transcriptional regulator